jgi:Tol biopolymer transport system component
VTGRRLLVVVVLLLCGRVLEAASLVDPALHFRMLRTAHFIIYFHQGEDRTARELAAIAEDAWVKLQRPLGVAPPKLTHVILADQAELSNGFATPLPYDTVFITAVWPAGSDFIGNTDDWLRLAFTHEFTHIVHLDRSEGWARVVRGIFGRTPVAFPNLFLPTWQIEGLATYEESVLTGEGRLHAGDFRAVTTEAARAGRLEPLDRVTGPIIDWPDGFAPYAYGVGFHAYLADTYGAAKFAALADATARRVPYTASRVFERIYGRPLGELWKEYEASVSSSAPPRSERVATQLTHTGFVAAGPRFASASEIVYSIRTPHEFPALEQTTVDGTATHRLATRYLGSTTGITAETIYFDQQEIRRNTGVYSDLYALNRRSGGVRALTSEARLLDPDVSPDGRTLACVQDAPGRRDLVLIDATGLDTGSAPSARTRIERQSASAVRVLISEPETQFNAPRWSPDGRFIAVERHRRGSLSEIVVVDPSAGTVRVVASQPDRRIVTPAWRRDGLAVIAAVAVEDDVFNLFEFSLAGGAPRQLTDTTGGATWPDVSPDGETIVFVGYTASGFDLFTMPYPQLTPAPSAASESDAPVRSQSTASSTDAMSSRAADGPSESQKAAAVRSLSPGAPDRGYSPWATLLPTSWSPVLTSDGTQVRAGVGVAGVDILQYHAYALSASWLVSGPAGASGTRDAVPDWQAAYAYNRWRPILSLTASTQTSFFAGPATSAGTPSSATERARQVEAGLLFPVSHVRTSQVAWASLLREVDEFALADRTITRNRTALRAAWSVATAHLYGYSISPEQGVALGVTSEIVRHELGAFADATTFTADARAYLPALAPHHVLALRAAAGASSGNIQMERTFHLGGPGPNADTLDFGRDAASLLRGFGADTFAGSHVAVMNADYRFPLVRPGRGVGTWPLFLQTMHAAVFADAGHAWTQAFHAADLKTAAGAELSTDIVAGYTFPITAAAGVAWGHDGSHTVRDGSTFYVRIGRAF